MKKLWKIIPFLALSAIIFLTGCEFSASTANVENVVLAKDEEGSMPASEFQSTDTVYAVVTLANAPDDTVVKASWMVVDVGDVAPPGQLIDEVELESGSGTQFFNLTPSSPFPAGKYKLDVYLNGELVETREFSVAGEVAAAPPEEPEDAPVPTEEPAAAGGPVSSLNEVQSATIRILSQGSFMDPEFGTQVNAAGQGSGFIIDPSGIAVTNNHVVTGAAFLEVYLEGETSPRNAKLLGVSECSDLAVIDIDGDGYPYLEWFDGDISVGQEIYVAGFPLFGNEEYTLTRGIISKEQANGETNWASIDHVLEVDANILGGNSGGPLVNADGQAIGVNYAARDDTRQGFSISRDEALDVIDVLRQGQDIHSIGINGRAVANEDGSIFGIWVSSVASGSPADQAGIQAGDILQKMEGLVLGTDGTISDYCEILRSRDPDDVMSIEVLRLATGEVLAGQLNGDKLEAVVGVDIGGNVEAGDSYDSYSTVTDDSQSLEVEVPTVWNDIRGGGWIVGEETLGPGLLAAPNVDNYLSSWDAPGMFFGASELDELRNDPTGVLDSYSFSDSCTLDGRYDYDDGLYVGQYDLWTNCAGTENVFFVLSAVPEDNRFVVVVQVQVTNTADEEALQHILDSFIVTE